MIAAVTVVKVLDMCTAPGSKTAQIVELLHQDDSKSVPGQSCCYARHDKRAKNICCDFCLCLQLLWMVVKILGSSCCFLSFLQLMLYCLFRKKRVSLEDISIFSALFLQTHAWGLFVFSLADVNESVDEHEIELYLHRIYIYTIDVEHCNIRHGHCLSGWIGYASSWKNVYNVLTTNLTRLNCNFMTLHCKTR